VLKGAPTEPPRELERQLLSQYYYAVRLKARRGIAVARCGTKEAAWLDARLGTQ